jgi:hypothetical protein
MHLFNAHAQVQNVSKFGRGGLMQQIARYINAL